MHIENFDSADQLTITSKERGWSTIPLQGADIKPLNICPLHFSGYFKTETVIPSFFSQPNISKLSRVCENVVINIKY